MGVNKIVVKNEHAVIQIMLVNTIRQADINVEQMS